MTGKTVFPSAFFMAASIFVILSISLSCGKAENKKETATPPPPVQKDYTIAAYFFPNWHPEPRIENIMGKGWTEWETVKAAKPRFDGHHQPKVPFWGYEDESNPEVMAKKIDAAADNGVDVFIFDWYWFDNKPFLEGALNNGFLKADNNNRIKFCLMWANHDAPYDMFPAGSKEKAKKAFSGTVTPEIFDKVSDHIVNDYFKNPAYWKIDGCPYFSIYELFRLIDNLGGAKETKKALDKLREKTKAAGFPDIHLNAVAWGLQMPKSEKDIKTVNELISYLGINSVTSYVWVHHLSMDNFPKTEYRDAMEKAIKKWSELSAEYPVPYHPNVSMGWDSSPRTDQNGPFENTGYPYTPVLVHNTPEDFHEALAAAKTFLSGAPADRKIVTINSWNEWTEGSYLEPDIFNGMKYLEAIKDVFGNAQSKKGE